MSRIIHYRYLSSYQTIFIIISIWIHNIPWPECQRLYRRTQCSGTRSEPWETGRASMSSSLIQIMNPKQHSSWLQTLTLSHRKWKQNRNKIKQGDKERDIFYWHRFSRRRKSQYQLLEYLTFEGKALNREKVDEITNFKCQSISPLLLELNERVCCLDPDFVFVFCTLWSHYAALCAHIMLRRNSFRVSLGRRCRPRDSCLQTRDQLGRAWQYRPDVTHPGFCYPGPGLIDPNFMITKSLRYQELDLDHVTERAPVFWPRLGRVTAQPARFKAQPGRDWSRNGWRAAIGRDEQVDVPIGQ